MTDALGQLDRLRREAVERARRGVIEARALQQRAELAWKDAQQLALRAERAQQAAQRAFSEAVAVLDLRAAEAQLADSRAAQAGMFARLRSCECTHAAALQSLRGHEQVLLEAELGRRAVARKLTQRAADVGRRTERNQEAEAEDAFRVTNLRSRA